MPNVDVENAQPLAAWAGLFEDTYRADDVPVDTFVRMLTRDPIVAYAKSFVQRGVRRRLGDYQHDDDRVRDFVSTRIMPALTRDVRGILSALYWGVSIAQPVYGYADGQIALRRLYTVHPTRYWQGRGFQRDDAGEFESVDVFPLGPVPFVNPQTQIRNLVHFACDNDFDTPWGNAACRRAYAAWYVKTRLQTWEAIALEKHGLPTAVFKVNGLTAAASGGSPAATYTAAWARMGAESALAIDNADSFEAIGPAWTGDSPFSAALRRLDAAIFNAFYQPYLVSNESSFGTRAQATVALEAYIAAETDMAEEAAALLIDQVIAPAIFAQFGPGVEPGAITVRDASPPDLSQWAGILQTLNLIGLFDPEAEEQIRWAGELFEMPVDELIDLTIGQPPVVAPAGPADVGRLFPGAGTPADQARVAA